MLSPPSLSSLPSHPVLPMHKEVPWAAGNNIWQEEKGMTEDEMVGWHH